MINFSVTNQEAITIMLALGLSEELSPQESKEKYRDAYQVLLSQYLPQDIAERKGTQND